MKITAGLAVQGIVYFNEIHRVWLVPQHSTAYVLDYSKIALSDRTSIAAKIRKDSEDCWENESAGKSSGDAWIAKGVLLPDRTVRVC